MIQARNRLLISLGVILIAAGASELSAQTPVDWVRLTSQPDGFEVVVPKSHILVLRTEDRTELAGGTKDASISISIRKQAKGHKQVRQMRSGSDQSVFRETTETMTVSVKRFLIGAPSYLNEIIYIGTEDRTYVISFDKEKDNQDLQKMRLSLKVGGEPLFKSATLDSSFGMTSTNLDDMDMSSDVQSA
jgi:hypothetical protein